MIFTGANKSPIRPAWQLEVERIAAIVKDDPNAALASYESRLVEAAELDGSVIAEQLLLHLRLTAAGARDEAGTRRRRIALGSLIHKIREALSEMQEPVG